MCRFGARASECGSTCSVRMEVAVPTSLRTNLMLKCAAAAWIPKNSSNQILTHYQILPWQLPILIPTHYQIPPVLPAQIVLSRSKERSPQELPKNPIRQKRRLRMIDEDNDGVRIKVISSYKQTFRRQMLQTNQLQDDFFLPNRAQLALNFLKKHGDHLVKEKTGPTKRFASTLQLVQHVLKQK